MPKGEYLRESWGDAWSQNEDEWLRVACMTSVSYSLMTVAYNAAFPHNTKSRSALMGRASRQGYAANKPAGKKANGAREVRVAKRTLNNGPTRATRIIAKAKAPVVFDDGLRDDSDPAIYRRSSPHVMKKTAADIAAAKQGKLPSIIEAEPLTSKPMLDTEHDECKWPTSTDVLSMEVCGAKATHGAYCERHAQVAYRTMPTRKRNKSYGRRGMIDTARRRIQDEDAQWIADHILDDEVTVA